MVNILIFKSGFDEFLGCLKDEDGGAMRMSERERER
jgi:hypothetical protein